MIFRYNLIIIILILIFAVNGGLYFASKILLPLNENATGNPMLIKIKSGLSVKAIADSLEKYEIVKDADDFIFTTKLFGNVAKLKAGAYQLNKGLSPYDVMKVMVEGKVSSVNIVIPEGVTSYQIASLFSKKLLDY